MNPALFQALYLHGGFETWSVLDLHKLAHVASFVKIEKSVLNKKYLLPLESVPKGLDIKLLTALQDHWLKTGDLESSLRGARNNVDQLFGAPRSLTADEVIQMIRATLDISYTLKDKRFISLLCFLCIRQHFRFTKTLYDNKTFKDMIIEKGKDFKLQSNNVFTKKNKTAAKRFVTSMTNSIKYTKFIESPR